MYKNIQPILDMIKSAVMALGVILVQGHMVNMATMMPTAITIAFWLREQLLQYQQRFENFLNQEVLYLTCGRD